MQQCVAAGNDKPLPEGSYDAILAAATSVATIKPAITTVQFLARCGFVDRAFAAVVEKDCGNMVAGTQMLYQGGLLAGLSLTLAAFFLCCCFGCALWLAQVAVEAMICSVQLWGADCLELMRRATCHACQQQYASAWPLLPLRQDHTVHRPGCAASHRRNMFKSTVLQTDPPLFPQRSRMSVPPVQAHPPQQGRSGSIPRDRAVAAQPWQRHQQACKGRRQCCCDGVAIFADDWRWAIWTDVWHTDGL